MFVRFFYYRYMKWNVTVDLKQMEVEMAADNVIDSLLLEIASDAGGADASIERMSNALEKLASSVDRKSVV